MRWVFRWSTTILTLCSKIGGKSGVSAELWQEVHAGQKQHFVARINWGCSILGNVDSQLFCNWNNNIK